jgi:hypothetical protein
MVPYADFNGLKFPDKAQALEEIRGLTCLTDILPIGFHGAITAGVGVWLDRVCRRKRGRSVSQRPPRREFLAQPWCQSAK